LPKLCRADGFALLSANLGQFSGVEPVPSAIGALVNLDPALCAKEVAMQSNPGTARTIPFPRNVDHDPIIPFEMKQRLAGRLLFLVDLLKLECVEPNAATTALADINHQAANLGLRQFIEASWAFHEPILP